MLRMKNLDLEFDLLTRAHLDWFGFEIENALALYALSLL